MSLVRYLLIRTSPADAAVMAGPMPGSAMPTASSCSTAACVPGGSLLATARRCLPGRANTAASCRAALTLSLASSAPRLDHVGRTPRERSWSPAGAGPASTRGGTAWPCWSPRDAPATQAQRCAAERQRLGSRDPPRRRVPVRRSKRPICKRETRLLHRERTRHSAASASVRRAVLPRRRFSRGRRVENLSLARPEAPRSTRFATGADGSCRAA